MVILVYLLIGLDKVRQRNNENIESIAMSVNILHLQRETAVEYPNVKHDHLFICEVIMCIFIVKYIYPIHRS